MNPVKERKASKVGVQLTTSTPPFPSDEELLKIVDESSFFKEKNRQAEEALAKIDWTNISKEWPE